MGIIRTTMLAFALAGGASGNGLEKTVRQDSPFGNSEEHRYVTVNGKTYRQRPPGAPCDPTLYGTPVKEEPKQPIPTGPIYFGLLAAAVMLAADTLRRRHDAVIAKYAPQRDFDFFNTQKHPTVDYEIEREEREF